ncbi:MAG: NADH:ubiquinone reductase (Na(+)-transporting) subunit A, partial [Bacteroidales bacterium]
MTKIIKITKGLNIPLEGAAEKNLQQAPRSKVYAVKPPDFHGLTPKMLVQEGDKVQVGTPLFFDKYHEQVIFTSPVSGTYTELVRGPKRRILEVRIQADEVDEYVDFGKEDPATLSAEQIREKLLKSGLWPAIIQRPYSMIAQHDQTPKAIFISAFNSAPLAPDNDFVVQGQEAVFQKGLDVLAKLTPGSVHLSVDADNTRSGAFLEAKGVQLHHFKGPHPAGNVGVQIHHIDPINKGDVVWQVSVQDVILIGRLFEQGIYDPRKIITLAGSEVAEPAYYKVISGASVASFAAGKVQTQEDQPVRYVSGDPLTGIKIADKGFLGYYHDQV